MKHLIRIHLENKEDVIRDIEITATHNLEQLHFAIVDAFEFKNNETLEDMLSFTGGVSSFGYKNKIFIESISGINKKISAIDSDNFNNTALSDGDIIRANPVADKYTNKVSIEGAV